MGCHLYAAVYYEDTDRPASRTTQTICAGSRARSDLLRGWRSTSAAIEAGGAYAVAEVNLKYLRPAKLDDDILIETRCSELKSASCRMHQLAFRLTGEKRELLAEAHFRVGFVSPEGRPKRQPEEWRAAFARFAEQGDQ